MFGIGKKKKTIVVEKRGRGRPKGTTKATKSTAEKLKAEELRYLRELKTANPRKYQEIMDARLRQSGILDDDEGGTGDPLDAFLTMRERLAKAGLIGEREGSTLRDLAAIMQNLPAVLPVVSELLSSTGKASPAEGKMPGAAQMAQGFPQQGAPSAQPVPPGPTPPPQSSPPQPQPANAAPESQPTQGMNPLLAQAGEGLIAVLSDKSPQQASVLFRLSAPSLAARIARTPDELLVELVDGMARALPALGPFAEWVKSGDHWSWFLAVAAELRKFDEGDGEDPDDEPRGA